MLLKGGNSFLDVSLFDFSEVGGDGDGSFDTFLAEFDLAGEELAAEEILFNVGRFNDTLFTVETSEDRVGEGSTSVSHGQGSRTSTFLSSNDFITTELDSLGDGGDVELSNTVVGELAEERNDGSTSMTTDDGDVALSGFQTESITDELTSTDRVQFGNTHDLARIMDTHLLEGFSEDRDGGVDRVANNEDASLRTSLSASLSKVHGNTGVGVEEIVTGHTGLSGNTSGNDDNIGAIEDLKEVFLAIVTFDLQVSVNVRKIDSNTRGTDNIVEGEARNERVLSHQQGNGLTNTTGSTEDGNLSTLHK